MASRISNLVTGKPKRTPAQIDEEIAQLRNERSDVTPAALAWQELNRQHEAERAELEEEWRRFKTAHLQEEVDRLEQIRLDRQRREALDILRPKFQPATTLELRQEGERKALRVNIEREAFHAGVERSHPTGHFVKDPAGDILKQSYEASKRRGEFHFDPNGMSVDAQIAKWRRGGNPR